MDGSKINDAVRDYLSQCAESGGAVEAGMRFLAALKDDPAWSEDEVAQVRDGIALMLGRRYRSVEEQTRKGS